MRFDDDDDSVSHSCTVEGSALTSVKGDKTCASAYRRKRDVRGLESGLKTKDEEVAFAQQHNRQPGKLTSFDARKDWCVVLILSISSLVRRMLVRKKKLWGCADFQSLETERLERKHNFEIADPGTHCK